MSLTKRNSIIYAWRPVLIMNGRSEMNEWMNELNGKWNLEDSISKQRTKKNKTYKTAG